LALMLIMNLIERKLCQKSEGLHRREKAENLIFPATE